MHADIHASGYINEYRARYVWGLDRHRDGHA